MTSPPELDDILAAIPWPELRRRLDARVTINTSGARALSRTAAAEVLGVTPATIAHWETTGELTWGDQKKTAASPAAAPPPAGRK